MHPVIDTYDEPRFEHINIGTEYLKFIVEDIISNISGAAERLNYHLVVEAKRLEKAVIYHVTSIANCSQRDCIHFIIFSKLVNICDLLYDATASLNPNVTVVFDVLTMIAQVIPAELKPNLKLPKAFFDQHHEEIAKSWLHHSSLMAQHQVPEKLVAIAGIPFKRFTEPKCTLLWGDYTWLNGYQAKLDILDWENGNCNSPAEALMSLLIGRDFNDDRFYIYCKKHIHERTNGVSGKRQRLLAYAECEKLVLEDTQIGTESFDHRANSVSTRLLKWIKEEIDFVETHEREVAHSKLNFQFYKYTLAFFFKLLHEQKVFGDISFRELSQQIAGSCTAMDEDIPADSIIKKAYLKKQTDFRTMEELLVKMLEYLRRFR